MKLMTIKSMSTLALTLVAGGVLATPPVAAETSTGEVAFLKGEITLGVSDKFDFGQHDITVSQAEYEAEQATELSVTDLRGTSEGWKVTVAQKGNFKTASGAELKGTTIRFAVGNISNSNGESPEIPSVAQVQPNAAAIEVLKAVKGKGNGVSKRQWAANHVRLIIPENTTQKANETYKATLEWTLAKAPN